jgi:hypothetical protein
VVDTPYIQSLLPSPLSELYPYLPFMHGLSIGDVATFCSVDPPDPSPVPTADQFLNMISGYPWSDVQYVNDWLIRVTQYFLWFGLCECASVTTPAPTNPTLPSPMPAINPGDIVGLPTILPCDNQAEYTFHASSTSSGGLGPPSPGYTGANVTLMRVYYHCTATSGAGYAFSWSVGWHLGTSLVATSGPFFAAVGATGHQDMSPPAAWDNAITSWSRGAGSGTSDLSMSADLYCDNGIPGGTQQPCCPPDPTLMAKLQSILDLVTLTQRQNAPFAYVSGAMHGGLTGTGSFGVQGILGLLANASVPSSSSLIGGTPDVRLPIGRINFATLDGWTDRYELVTDSQLVIPPAAGIYTDVGYSLEPGVTLSLTELLREP